MPPVSIGLGGTVIWRGRSSQGPVVVTSSVPPSLTGAIRKVHDFALIRTVDRTVRLIDEAIHVVGMPMVAARLLLVAVHALLHDSPFAVIGHEESVEVEVESVLHGCAVDLGDQAACTGQAGSVETDAFAKRMQFVRRLPRMLPPATADMHAEFAGERRQPALEGTDDAGRDARRMPIHAHDRAERLEPEGMRETP